MQQLAPSTNATILLHAVATGDGSANIAWNASAPAVVYWYAEAPCNPPPGWCFEGGALANWSGMLGGQWSWQGNVASLYCLYIVDKADRSVNITASFAESYPTSTHRLPLVPFLWTMAGGSLLLGVGGMAVYLGVFLPAGVYSTPAAVPRDPNADPDPDYRFPAGALSRRRNGSLTPERVGRPVQPDDLVQDLLLVRGERLALSARAADSGNATRSMSPSCRFRPTTAPSIEAASSVDSSASLTDSFSFWRLRRTPTSVPSEMHEADPRAQRPAEDLDPDDRRLRGPEDEPAEDLELRRVDRARRGALASSSPAVRCPSRSRTPRWPGTSRPPGRSGPGRLPFGTASGRMGTLNASTARWVGSLHGRHPHDRRPADRADARLVDRDLLVPRTRTRAPRDRPSVSA